MKFRPLHRSKLAVALATAGLLVGACAGSSDSDEPEKKPSAQVDSDLVTGMLNIDDSGTPVKGGTLTIAEYSEARSLSPWQTYSNGAAGGSALLAVYDSLVSYDWETRAWVPRMAESLESSDNITWTLKLRDGVKFSDGTPYNADNVIASIQTHIKNNGFGSLQWNAHIKSMNKVDDSTIEFTTHSPWSTFPSVLALGPGLVMAPAAYADPANFKPIGAGPFVFDSYAPAESLVLKANDTYWDGRPNLDRLKIVWPGGDPAKLENLRNGDIDAAFIRDDVVIEELLKDKAPGMRWVVGSGDSIWMNQRAGRDTAMKEVRDALQLAWDPVKYAERTGRDTSLATKSLWPANSPWYTGVATVDQDLAKARERLADAKAKGFDGELELITFGDAASQKRGVAVQAQLEAVGFKVSLRLMKSIADQLQALYIDHNYDLAFAGLTLNEEDPYFSLSGATSPQSMTNTAGINNVQLSQAIAQIAAAPDEDAAKEAMVKVEELWQADSPLLSIATGQTFGTWSTKVHGVVPTTQTMFFYDKAWKDK